MYEKEYQVIISTDGDMNELQVVSEVQNVTVFYDNKNADSTILNIKAICLAIQALLYEAIHSHYWPLAELCESALESIDTVNYQVEGDIITVYT